MIPDIRVGTGYDVHSFIEHNNANINEHYIILGGIKIPYERKLNGHSDSDVALHALTDAILGTYNLGDIGTYFPPSEAKWKNASSSIFVKKAVEFVGLKGGAINNVDITIIAQEPTIAPYRETMCKFVASLLCVDINRVSIKATTNEHIGFIGRGEGIACLATACVMYV